MSEAKERKAIYYDKLVKALDEYPSVLLINVDFVGSNQIQQVRLAIRGRAIMLMGKNTLIRKVIRERMVDNPKLECLLPRIVGNMGFIFCKENLNELRKEVQSFTVPAAAKAGVIAPISVTIPAGPTGLDPAQTNFFAALNILTKIVKSSIEIMNPVDLITKGAKVTATAVALLNKMGIRPFVYGIAVTHVFEEGSLFSAHVLDLSEDDLLAAFFQGVGKLAAISFEIGQVNQATVPHSFGRAFKLLCALCINSEYEFEEMKIVKEMLANPGAFAPAAAAAAGGVAVAAAPEPEEDEEEAAPMGLFGEEEAAGDY